jgi:hypothetical protein
METEATYVKVVGFPGGESMWVKLITGTEDEGTGILDNDPICSDEVKCGDWIRYSGGTDDLRPQYAGKCKGVKDGSTH